MRRYIQWLAAGATLNMVGILSGCSTVPTKPMNQSAIHTKTNTIAPTTTNRTTGLTSANQSSKSSITQPDRSFDPSYEILSANTVFASAFVNRKFYIWRTSDSGAHWKRYQVADVPVSNPPVLLQPHVKFISKNVGCIVWMTHGNKVSTLTTLRTNTGGRTWTKHTQSVSSILAGVIHVDFSSPKDGWIQAGSVGSMEHSETSIFHTTDGGRTWKLVSADTGYVQDKQATPHALPESGVGGIKFIGARTGWVPIANYMPDKVSAPPLYQTHTAGRTWYPVHIPIAQNYQHGYYRVGSMPIFDGKSGTIMVQYVNPQSTRIHLISYHTSNGEKTWTAGETISVRTQSTSYPYLLHSFVNPNTGWIIGRQGKIFERTGNGGRSWTSMPISMGLKPLFRQGDTVVHLKMINSTTGWMILIGPKPELMKTVNGGKSWSSNTLQSADVG